MKKAAKSKKENISDPSKNTSAENPVEIKTDFLLSEKDEVKQAEENMRNLREKG